MLVAMAQTIFITGSSTGLGRATAKLFASRGWRVFATMRQPGNDTELANTPGVVMLPLDVTKRDQIKAAADAAIAQGGVDVLFNNAGYGLFGPLEGVSDDQLTRQIETNLLGVMRTTQAFLPHMRERRSGLIVTTTSIGGLVAFPLNSVYHATKWALEGWSESLAFELQPFNVRVKTVSPGGIQSDFASRSLDVAPHPAYASIIEKVAGAFQDPNRRASHSTSEAIAEVVLEAVTDGTDRLRYTAGADAKGIYASRLAQGDEAFRKGIGAAFMGQ
jgi:NAD(P)-dependent dehydrogenase (short-subunit alcohol dehydrogenase family)